MSVELLTLIALESALIRAQEIRQDFEFMTEAEIHEKAYAMDDELDHILSAGVFMLREIRNKIETDKAVYEQHGKALQ